MCMAHLEALAVGPHEGLAPRGALEDDEELDDRDQHARRNVAAADRDGEREYDRLQLLAV